MREKEKINEMDAAEMLAAHRAENPDTGHREGEELEVEDVIRAVADMEEDRLKREGWAALGLGLVSALVVAACCTACGSPSSWGSPPPT